MPRQRTSAKEKRAQRQVFEQDEDSHWYCIPLSMKELFHELLCGIPNVPLKSIESYDQSEVFNDKFGPYRLPGGISNYSFTDMQEIEGA